MPERIANWAPGDFLEITLDDNTGGVRTKEELDAMMEEIREVANGYGFDLSAWGGHRARIKRSLIELEKIVDIYHHLCDLDAKGELIKAVPKP